MDRKTIKGIACTYQGTVFLYTGAPGRLPANETNTFDHIRKSAILG